MINRPIRRNPMGRESLLALAFLSVLSAILPTATSTAWATPSYLDSLKYPLLHEIRTPKVERYALKNGMTLLLMEDHELPVVNCRALIRVGRIYEPAGNAGLTELFGEVLRTGGTQQRTGDELDERLERIGASIESGVGESNGSLSAFMLKENVDAVLPLFAEVLVHPAFSQDKIDLAKTHMHSGIARRNDQVFGILFREYAKLLYGKDSPYARQYEYSDVDRLTRDDLLAFHGKYYHPGGLILGIWGDFQPAEMKKRVEELFSSWKPVAIGYPPLRAVDTTLVASLNYIEKKDIDQSFILLGHLGGRLDDADYPRLYLMSQILGSGWASRMFKKVRSEKGLAYSAGGAMMPAYDHPGAFYAFCSTKFSTTSEALSSMIEEVKRMQIEEVTDEELAIAKEGYLNSFAFEFDSPDKVMERLLTYEYFHYPRDFLQKVRSGIEKVTRADLLAAAREDLHPDKLIVLVVGDAGKFDKPLSTFGAVNTIDITIPEPKEEVKAATSESIDRAKEILGRAIAALGGLEKVAAVKSEKARVTLTMSLPSGEMTMQASQVQLYPDRLRAEMETPMGKVIQVLDGTKGWMSTPQGVNDLEGSGLDELKKQARLSLLNVLMAIGKGKASVQSLGQAEFEGKKSDDVLVTLEDGNSLHLFVDPNDSALRGRRYRSLTPEGPGEIDEVYSDFRTVSGIRLPHTVVQKSKGKVVVKVQSEEIILNAPVGEGLFKKP